MSRRPAKSLTPGPGPDFDADHGYAVGDRIERGRARKAWICVQDKPSGRALWMEVSMPQQPAADEIPE